jgi:hypothetical protein
MPAADFDPTIRRAYSRMAADLEKIFGERFVALVASPRGLAAAFATSIGATDLDALGPAADAWRRDQLEPPLLLTPDEFRRSLDTFPAEYQTLLDSHVVIAGRAPFDDARIQPDDLRRACEVQARGHLIHLRQGWMTSGSHHHELGALVAQSAAPFRAVLANLVRLHGEPADVADDDDRLAKTAARLADLPEGVIRDVLALTDAPHRRDAMVSRIGEYLAACERLWAYVDRWRAR